MRRALLVAGPRPRHWHDRCDITRWRNMWDADAVEEQTSWSALFEELSERRPFRGHGHHPGWSPAVFAPAFRAPGCLRAACALVLWHRGGSEPISRARKRWADTFGLIYTTPDHELGVHDIVVLLPLARAVSLAEHGTLRRWAWEVRGAAAPPAWCFFPSAAAKPSAPFSAHVLDGQPLDPDRLLFSVE